MKNWKIIPINNYFKAAISSALLLSPCATQALPPCANNSDLGGQMGLNVKVKINASDLANNSADTWRKIAEATQAKYGEFVAQDAGMVQVTVIGETFLGGTTPIGNFPIGFDGSMSIGQSILVERGLQNTFPSAMQSMGCDPNKNDGKDCCDECANGFAMLSPLDIFNTGHLIPGTKAIKRPSGTKLLSNRIRLAA